MKSGRILVTQQNMSEVAQAIREVFAGRQISLETEFGLDAYRETGFRLQEVSEHPTGIFIVMLAQQADIFLSVNDEVIALRLNEQPKIEWLDSGQLLIVDGDGDETILTAGDPI